MTSTAPLLFSLEEYHSFSDVLSQKLCAEIGEIERRVFPDGERYQRLCTDVHERAVILVGGTIGDQATLSLYDIACACVKYGARRLDVCVPYFGYSTMERAVRSGEVVTAKTRARLLSAVPPSPGGNHFHLFELHSDGIPHYFEGAATARHLKVKPILTQRLKEIAQGDFVLASTDAGRAKQIEALANALDVDAALIIKRRLSGSKTEVLGVNARVEGKVVVIYDDMIRTGGSLIQAARAYRDAGATEIFAVCTHAVLPEGSWERIQGSNLFEKVIATDSHPNAMMLEKLGLEVLNVSSIFANSLSVYHPLPL